MENKWLTKRKKILKRLSITLLVLIISILIISPYLSNAIFFGPDKTLTNYPDTTTYRVEEVNFKSINGKNLNAWFLKPKHDSVIATILQLHGNGGNISYQYQFAEPLIKKGFQIFVFDYQGYGKSEGEPTQENVLEDGIAALNYIKNRPEVAEKKLLLFGQSLGAHLAVVIAAKKQKMIDALIVEDPFSGHVPIAVYHGKKSYHIPEFVVKLLIRSKYEAIDFVKDIKIPKLFIHSEEDQICPYFMGQELYKAALAPKDFWSIKGGHIQASHLYPAEFAEHFLEMLKK